MCELNQTYNPLKWEIFKKPYVIENGILTIPDKPGLGFDDINEDLFRARIDPRDPVYFDQPTDMWDNERSWDRLWS